MTKALHLRWLGRLIGAGAFAFVVASPGVADAETAALAAAAATKTAPAAAANHAARPAPSQRSPHLRAARMEAPSAAGSQRRCGWFGCRGQQVSLLLLGVGY